MIRLDHRVGSGELERFFQPYGIKVQKTTIAFGDMDFIGNGKNGQVSIVVERKRIEDLIQSMHSKRLSGHQLPGMAEQYDYCYLIVEGIWQPGDQGQLEIRSGNSWVSRGVHTRAVNNYLMGLSLRAGLQVWRTSTPKETVSFVVDQYRMWTEKTWDEHKCHEAVYAPAGESGGAGRRLSLNTRKIGLPEKFAMQWPGVDSKARDIERHFRDLAGGSWLAAMAAATAKDFEEIKGIGKIGAERIWEALHK
jgi:ERCC4-type nuclease